MGGTAPVAGLARRVQGLPRATRRIPVGLGSCHGCLQGVRRHRVQLHNGQHRGHEVEGVRAEVTRKAAAGRRGLRELLVAAQDNVAHGDLSSGGYSGAEGRDWLSRRSWGPGEIRWPGSAEQGRAPAHTRSARGVSWRSRVVGEAGHV